jgi:Zn-dependent peptidase ImmA (M78 family)
MRNIPAEATRDASQLLDQAWASPFGVDVPVDPVSIAKALGVEVFTADLDMGVAGLLVKRRGQDPAIYLNARDSENRQRFTCAHELGHYIRRTVGDDAAWEFVDRRDQLASEGTDPEERYANSFAAQLLMPEHEVRSHAKKMDAATMAYTFGVSLEAMKNRLATLRIDV